MTELVLRGIFLLRSELEWFYQQGASWIFPDAWEHYLAPIPEAERGDMMRGLPPPPDQPRSGRAARGGASLERLGGRDLALLPDADVRRLRRRTTSRSPSPASSATTSSTRGFLTSDDQLLADVARIRNIPGVIVQGRYDVVCPMESAWDLHRAWPEAELIIVPDSGHTPSTPPNSRALVAATDKFAG